MRSIISFTLLFAGAINAQDSFLGFGSDNRNLQVQGNTYTQTCIADLGCNANFCCAQFKEATSGTAAQTVLKTCVPTQLHNQVVTAADGTSYSWVCINNNRPQALAASQTSCTANSGCGSGSCCQSQSFGIWGMSQNLGKFCAAKTDSGLTTFQNYNVGKAPSNFTANVTLTQSCMADPVVVVPPSPVTPPALAVEPTSNSSTSTTTPDTAVSPQDNSSQTIVPVDTSSTPSPASANTSAPIDTTSTVSLDQTVKTADMSTTTTTTSAQKSGASQLIQASILALASIAAVSFF